MRRYINVDEAIELLPERDSIHAFYNYPLGLIGVDRRREDIINKLQRSEKIELTGEMARNMGHGMAAYNEGCDSSEVLFIETDMNKLNEFDPIYEMSEEEAQLHNYYE